MGPVCRSTFNISSRTRLNARSYDVGITERRPRCRIGIFTVYSGHHIYSIRAMTKFIGTSCLHCRRNRFYFRLFLIHFHFQKQFSKLWGQFDQKRSDSIVVQYNHNQFKVLKDEFQRNFSNPFWNICR